MLYYTTAAGGDENDFTVANVRRLLFLWQWSPDRQLPVSSFRGAQKVRTFRTQIWLFNLNICAQSVPSTETNAPKSSLGGEEMNDCSAVRLFLCPWPNTRIFSSYTVKDCITLFIGMETVGDDLFGHFAANSETRVLRECAEGCNNSDEVQELTPRN